MPVEIRELIIRTEISSASGNQPGSMKEQDFNLLKKQLLEECRRIISGNAKKSDYKR
jgi:hypothetical protein